MTLPLLRPFARTVDTLQTPCDTARRARNVAIAALGLPQLWNVLAGDMNVIGPRPEQPAILAQLRGQIQEYVQRQRVLRYIRQRSMLEDLKIMLLTPTVMLGRRRGW